ncbi:MAG TPA: tetratricopeptide repeat protein [Chthonomonadaceae bacterium]|nr:tetratricopeptide repeat protein [Chthonomonadaceae bacterium]
MEVKEPETLWTEAVAYHVAGKLGEAERLYQRVLATDSAHANALDMLGVLQFQQGQGQAALEWIDQAIVLDDRSPVYHGHRGLVLASMGEFQEAITAYQCALALDPTRAETLNNLGSALWAGGDLSGAVLAYRQALTVDPDQAESAANLGWALLNTGALEEAIEVLERALRLHPSNPTLIEHLSVAQNNQGAGLLRGNETEQALSCFRKALALRPDFFEAHFNAGKALAQGARYDEAIPSYRRALELEPANAEVHNDLGVALCARGQMLEALVHYREALRFHPEYVQAWNNLGNALRIQGLLSESVECYREALRLEPGDAEVWNNLGSARIVQGDPEAAIEALEKALTLRPDLSEAHNNLGNVYKDLGDLDAALRCYAQAVVVSPANQDARSNWLYTLYFHPNYALSEIYRRHADWYAQQAEGLCPENPTWGNDRSPGRKLRVGYVGPFFREHCQALFLVPLLEHHDHDQVEVFVYSDVATPDAVTVRLQARCDTWRNIAGMADAAAAERIREDRIDILVDLALHMAGNRMQVFARKPAPVQVTWLGYPGTTGLETMDYRLTDPYLDPLTADNDVWYAEQSVRLPHTFWCYDPLTSAIPTNALPAERNGYVTFGCLSNFCKINAGTLRLWAGALNAVPQSRLLLLAPEGRARRWVLDTLQQQGVDASRIEFVDRQPRSQYLELYHRIDVGLETVPYNGHTTTLDSLWMGVPVLTRVGDAPVGRAGWSQLSNLGLQELAAETDSQYAQLAARVCSDLPALSRLRAELRDRMLQSPLGDGARFARDIEAAYRQMWETYCTAE